MSITGNRHIVPYIKNIVNFSFHKDTQAEKFFHIFEKKRLTDGLWKSWSLDGDFSAKKHQISITTQNGSVIKVTCRGFFRSPLVSTQKEGRPYAEEVAKVIKVSGHYYGKICIEVNKNDNGRHTNGSELTVVHA